MGLSTVFIVNREGEVKIAFSKPIWEEKSGQPALGLVLRAAKLNIQTPPCYNENCASGSDWSDIELSVVIVWIRSLPRYMKKMYFALAIFNLE